MTPIAKRSGFSVHGASILVMRFARPRKPAARGLHEKGGASTPCEPSRAGRLPGDTGCSPWQVGRALRASRKRGFRDRPQAGFVSREAGFRVRRKRRRIPQTESRSESRNPNPESRIKVNSPAETSQAGSLCPQGRATTNVKVETGGRGALVATAAA